MPLAKTGNLQIRDPIFTSTLLSFSPSLSFLHSTICCRSLTSLSSSISYSYFLARSMVINYGKIASDRLDTLRSAESGLDLSDSSTRTKDRRPDQTKKRPEGNLTDDLIASVPIALLYRSQHERSTVSRVLIGDLMKSPKWFFSSPRFFNFFPSSSSFVILLFVFFFLYFSDLCVSFLSAASMCECVYDLLLFLSPCF